MVFFLGRLRSWLPLASLMMACTSDGSAPEPGGSVTPSPVLSAAPIAPLPTGSTPSKPAPQAVVPRPTYKQTIIGSMPDKWELRDGSLIVQLPTGRLIMEGGWNYNDPWIDADGNNQRLTNEVWASDDEGVHWFLLLPHD